MEHPPSSSIDPGRRAAGVRGGVILAALLALTASGCLESSQPWGRMPSAFGVRYETGNRAELYDAQLGLEGGGENGRGELAAADALGFAGAVRAICGPAGHGDHPAFVVRLVPLEQEGFEVAVRVEGFHGEGSYEGEARVVRVGEGGELLESRGTARLVLEDAVHRAGLHGFSGTVSAEVAGEAGRGTLEGSFQRCYFFT